VFRRRLRRRAATALSGAGLAVLIGAGCGGQTPPAPQVPEAPADETGRLVVEQRLVPGSRMPTEGSFGFYELEGTGELPVASGSIPTTRRGLFVDRRVPAGDYALVSYQRPCEADCGRLGPPVDRCEEPITVEAGARLDVTVRVSHGEPCEIAAG